MQNNKETNKPNSEPEHKPDEEGQILVDEHIKIFDPETGDVFLNKRETK